MQKDCPACGARMTLRLISEPAPNFVQRCRDCGSAFFSFGEGAAISHVDQYGDADSYQDYLRAQNNSALSDRHEETLGRLRELLGCGALSIFDVGAGAGGFLMAARTASFEVAGNEISLPAVAAASENGIALTFGEDLQAMAKERQYDAVTMWCVIAHVDDPGALLRGCRSLLAEGGVLFFHTPRWCLVDTVALALKRVTRDRYRLMFDRRINRAHRRQYSGDGMKAMLVREGFEPISVEPVVAYGLHFNSYLSSMGLPRRLAQPLGRFLEWVSRFGALPRNTLNVYARPTQLR